jgi:hypothetical protein
MKLVEIIHRKDRFIIKNIVILKQFSVPRIKRFMSILKLKKKSFSLVQIIHLFFNIINKSDISLFIKL